MTVPLALVIHDLVLSLAFFVVVVPVGLVLWLFGRDPLQLKIDRRTSTYWQPKKQPRDVRSYFRPLVSARWGQDCLSDIQHIEARHATGKRL